jgi:5-methylcytosine-specific restriction endonuclease McrA
MHAHNRRALKRNALGSHTKEEVFQQLERQKIKCYYCKKKLSKGKDNWHADHIVPISRGGSNDISNIVIACPPCNMRKHNKYLHEWLDGGRLL